MRIVDLSVPLRDDVVADPPGMQPRIERADHAGSVDHLLSFFPGLQGSDLPGGEAWAVETVTLSTHNGTHLDAPWHYSSTTDHALVPGGRRSPTIDEIPLDWCFRPGVKLDFRHLPDGAVVRADEVERELRRIGHVLAPLDIVLVNTRAGLRYGHDDYLHSGCGMGREATLFLLEQGVRVTGTDAWSWDAPFSHTAARFAREGDPAVIWEGHKAGRDIGYCHLEKLHNLEELPPDGFRVCCFPVKIAGASAGWTRAVAILEGEPAGRSALGDPRVRISPDDGGSR